MTNPQEHACIGGQRLRPETLKLRMERAAYSAQLIADWLRVHPLVARTYYLTHLEHNPAQQDITAATASRPTP